MSLIERALERLKQEEAGRRKAAEATAKAAPSAAVIPAASDTPSTAIPATRSSRESLEPAQAIPCRGDRILTIDLQALRAAGTLAPTTEERRLAEEYRNVKRPLLKGIA